MCWRSIRLILIWSFLTCLITSVQAQNPDTLHQQDTLQGWKIGGFGNLNFSQATFVNWAAGGENSFSIIGTGNLSADYFKEIYSWENTIDLAYGLLRSGRSTIIKKTEDKIDFNSTFEIGLNKRWRYSSFINFKTQFTKGYNYPDDSTVVSDFMAPGYLVLATGINFKPVAPLQFTLAPLSGKMTFVLDKTLANQGAYGVKEAARDSTGTVIEPGRQVRAELGATFIGKYEQEVVKNVHIHSKIELFSNYLNNPQNIDISWETTIAMKVNKFLSANVFAHLLYDHDIDIPTYEVVNGQRVQVGAGPKTQLKETLGIGISYDF